MARARCATPENEEATQVVMDLAESWRNGGIELAGVRRQCSGYDRFIAMNHAREQVRDLIDALAGDDDAREGAVETKHGVFWDVDIRANGGILATLNGRRVLRWPTSGNVGRWRYGETH